MECLPKNEIKELILWRLALYVTLTVCIVHGAEYITPLYVKSIVKAVSLKIRFYH